MTPKELQHWPETGESQSMGQDEDGESTGHRSRAPDRRNPAQEARRLTRDDLQHMRKVHGYVARPPRPAPGRGERALCVALLAHELGARPAQVGYPARRRGLGASVEYRPRVARRLDAGRGPTRPTP